MSDPFRDHEARKAAKRRESIKESHTPLVLWLKVPEDKSLHVLRNWIIDRIRSIPYVSVEHLDAPFQYATDGTLRPEDAKEELIEQ